MFRANVYSLNPLTSQAREAVHDGIGMVAAYMGETAAAKELLVRLPLTSNGTIDPARIGYGKLDKMVELHLMAVPLDRGDSERIGLAELGRGCAFVDTSRNSIAVIRATTAHETAHSLGFVSPLSTQTAPDSPYHCNDESCIMHKKVTLIIDEIESPIVEPQKSHRTYNPFKLHRQPQKASSESQQTYEIVGKYDFCLPCKIDLREKGSQNLAEIRHSRLFSRKAV